MKNVEKVAQHKIPMVDLGRSEQGGEARIAEEIAQACMGTGFFYLRNHGVPSALVDAAFQANQAFHRLSLESKLAVKINGAFRGYQPLGGSTLKASTKFDSATYANQVESFFVRNEDAEILASGRATGFMMGPNQWPRLEGFKEAVVAYEAAMRALGMRMLPLFARAVGEAPDYFTRLANPASVCIRLLHYPPVSDAEIEAHFRIFPHTDYGFLTFLAQDDSGGLQIRGVDGAWIDAAPMPGTFVVNVGDLLQRWTNGAFQSTPHRVVGKSAGRDRYSIAYFFGPNDDTRVDCLPAFLQGGEARHPPAIQGEYIAGRMSDNYQDRR